MQAQNSPPECHALSGRAENAQTESGRDKVERFGEQVGAAHNVWKRLTGRHGPAIDRDDQDGGRRLWRKRAVGTTGAVARPLRQAVIQVAGRGIGALPFGHRMVGDRPAGRMDHQHIVAAAGLGHTRAQQQSRKQRERGRSAVPNRSRWDKPDHALTRRMKTAEAVRRPELRQHRRHTRSMQNTRCFMQIQEKSSEFCGHHARLSPASRRSARPPGRRRAPG